jgi:HlyD family secretion protein
MPIGSAPLARAAAVGLFVVTLGSAVLLLGPGGPRPAAGWVQEDRRTLGFVEAGHLVEVRVADGQVVTEGEVLAQLDPSAIDAEIAALEAASRSLVDRARNRAFSVDADRAVTAGRTAAATEEARAARAKADALAGAVAELEAQIARGLGGGDDLAGLRAEAVAAEATATSLAATAGALRRLEVPAPPLRADAAAEAELEALQKQLAALQVRRDALTVRAPTDGRVAALLHRVGDVVPAGEPVVEIVGTVADRAIACVDARSAAHLRERQRVAVVDVAVGTEIPGHVLAVGPAFAEADARCRTSPYQPGWVLPVVLRLEGEPSLAPGAAVRVRWLDEVAPPEPAELRVGRNPS